MTTKAISRRKERPSIARPPPAAPPQRRTQAERTRQTKLKLLQASLAIMLREGYIKLRIAEIAKVAGTSRGALLHHYPSKDDIVLATVEFAYTSALDRARLTALRYKHSADPIRGIIEDGKEFFFSDFFFLLQDIRYSSASHEAAQLKARQLGMQFRLPVEELWKDVLVEAGLPPPIAEDTVWLTFAIVRGMAVRTLMYDDPERFERLYALWREIFWTYWKAKRGKKASKPA